MTKQTTDQILNDPEFDNIADETVKTGYKMYFNTGVRPENAGAMMKFQVIKDGTKQIEFYLEREPEKGLIFRHLQSNIDNLPSYYTAIKVIGGGMLSDYAIFLNKE